MSNKQQNVGEASSARLASMIGLCRRAGRLGCGVEAVKDALKTGRQHLVLLASDPSDRTRKQITNKCASAGARCVCIPLTKEELGRACGLDELSVCCVSDPRFIQAIADLAGTP